MKKFFTLITMMAVGGFVCPAFAQMPSAPITDIIQNPQGQIVYYEKQCYGTFVLNGMQMYEEKFPAVLIYGDNNTVYFRNLVAVFPDDYYLKGTIEGNKIVMPCNQTIEYIPEDGYGVNFGVFKASLIEDGSDSIEYKYAADIKQVEFTVAEDGSIKMVLPGEPFDGEHPGEYIAGFYYTDDYQYLGYGDFYQEYTKLDLRLNAIPEGMKIEPYIYVDSYNYAYQVDVAFGDDTLYIRGLCDMLPEGTLTGAIKGNKAYIRQNEFLGIYFEQDYIFSKILLDNPDFNEDNTDVDPFILAPADMEFELIIDPENKTIYSENVGKYLSFHGNEKDVFNSLGLYGEFILRYQESMKGTPDVSTDLVYTTEWARRQGFNDFQFHLSNFSTSGTLLDTDHLYYKIFINGEPQIFVEQEITNLLGKKVTAYAGVPTQVVLLPYNFNNNDDIFKFFDNDFDIGIYRDDVETIGVQSVYVYEDEYTYSDIAVLTVATGETEIFPAPENAGISAVEGEAVAREYFTPDGLRVSSPSGLTIERTVFSNGTVKTRKFMAR